MKLSKIKYDPRKSMEEIAAESGVGVEAVRRYIKSRRIDRKCDERLLKYRKVRRYMREHPEATVPIVAKALDMAPGTVRSYARMKQPPAPAKGKISMVQECNRILYVSVSPSQHDILRAILTTHLKGAVTFDCDLTAGKGGFYRRSVPLPQFLYDINPQFEGVNHLDEAINLPDEVFDSVVVDLPYSVCRPGSRMRERFMAFDSAGELRDVYGRISQLAWRLLAEGGLMVMKTVDYSIAGEASWVSDIAVAIAVAAGFELADKYIFIDREAINKVSGSARRGYIPTHAYFLVWRKAESAAKHIR